MQDANYNNHIFIILDRASYVIFKACFGSSLGLHAFEKDCTFK